MRRRTDMQLPRDQIQGNITPGFRKDHQAFLLFQFPAGAAGVDAAQAWIRAIRPYISTAEEVATYNQLFRLVKKRLPKQESAVLHSSWVNVGFTARGLQRLISDTDFKKLPREF